MKVIKVKLLDGYVLPVDLADQPIFQHCTGGLCAVSPQRLSVFDDVFALHDIAIEACDAATGMEINRLAKAK